MQIILQVYWAGDSSSAVKKAERLLKNMFIVENTVEKRVFFCCGTKNFDSHLSQHCTSLSISRRPLDNRFRLPKTTENLPRETWLPNYSSPSLTPSVLWLQKKAEHENQLRMNVHKKGIRQWVTLREKMKLHLTEEKPPWREQGRRFHPLRRCFDFKSHNAMLGAPASKLCHIVYALRLRSPQILIWLRLRTFISLSLPCWIIYAW